MNTEAKILLTDDSSFMRKMIKDILIETGFTNFIEAENGKEAVEKFNTEKPDLIILDLIMPEMDGMSVLKAIGKQAKIIVVSAVGQDQMVSEAKQNGALGYIVKPFERENVIEEIKKIMN